jgi:hypothetical protein
LLLFNAFPHGLDRERPFERRPLTATTDGRPDIPICREAAVVEATGDPTVRPVLRLKVSGRIA